MGVAEEILLELHFLRLAVLVDPTSWLRNPVSGRDRLNSLLHPTPFDPTAAPKSVK